MKTEEVKKFKEELRKLLKKYGYCLVSDSYESPDVAIIDYPERTIERDIDNFIDNQLI